jgi:cytochrome c biogenesis factor
VRRGEGSPEVIETEVGSVQELADGRHVIQVSGRAGMEDDAIVIAVQNIQAAGKDVLVVEASEKPWINLVWSGFIILVVSLIATVYRRAREAARSH